MSYRKMTVAEWIAVAPNPIQRDTERHATKAKHLLTPRGSHQFVFAAELPNGRLIKLDGHTRALMWKRGDVEKPPHVLVGVIPVKDMAGVEQMYQDFDSRDALETTRDKVSGAFNRHNFQPSSGLLQAGNMVQSLRIAMAVLNGGVASHGTAGFKNTKKVSELTKYTIYEMVNEFSYELHALDGFMLQQSRIRAGVIAAFILSMRRYGHKVTPFWQGVFANTGSKHGQQMDMIQATVELLMRRRGTSGGGSANSDLTARCLSGVEKWLKDEVTTRVPSPMDTLNYLKGHTRPNERLIKMVDKRLTKPVDKQKKAA